MNSLKRRGQVMVLACVTMLVIALTIMMSYNVNLAIHERMRLQQHADSMAFSLAVLEARALNTAAHGNRAIGSALVAGISVQGFVAIAANLIPQMQHSVQHHRVYKDGEELLCNLCKRKCVHCQHVQLAKASIACFEGLVGRVTAGHSATKGAAQGAMADLHRQITDIHKDMNAYITWTKNQMKEGNLLKELKDDNGPHIEGELNLLASVSQAAWACGVEGSTIDGECNAINGGSGNYWGAGQRDQLEMNTAMAARPDLDDKKHKNAANMAHEDFTNGPIPDKGKIENPPKPYGCIKLPGKWEYTVPIAGGTVESNGTQKATFDIPSSPVYTEWGCKAIPKWWGRDDAKGHSDMPPGTAGTDYFINFRVSSDQTISYGEPNAYAGAKQQLRRNGRNGAGGADKNYPWQLTAQGRTTVNIPDDKPWSLVLPPIGQGFAVAKAKAYFHQMEHWEQPPNSFDPFWHAKLHYFGRQELQTALNRAGDTDGARVAATAPVEGDINPGK